MGKIAQVYEDELDEEIRTISTAGEPILSGGPCSSRGGMVGAIPTANLWPCKRN